MVKNPIDRLIEAKETKIATCERAIEKYKIEIAALRKAREAVDNEYANPSTERTATDHPRKGRSLSAQWKEVLRAIGKMGENGADLDEVYEFCRQQNIELLRPTLRAQMSNYV